MSFNPILWMNFLSYQFKVAVILLCFYVFYRLLMSKETFHRLNRFLLMGMLVGSFVLPFCVIKIHRMEPAQTAQAMPVQEEYMPQMPPISMPPVAAQEFAGPEGLYVDIQEVEVAEPAPVAPVQRREPFDWWLLAVAMWFAGCVFHLSRTVLSVLQVRRLIRSGKVVWTDGKIRIHVVELNISPFSWMNDIVLSAQDYESYNRQVIIDHEMAHVRRGHSFDLILVDLLSAMQWFNPVTNMLRKDLQDVHEFQADGRVLKDGFDAKAYQYMLLGKVASMSGYSVTNHFKKQNLSNRISMMNRKDSKFARAFKALYAPLLTGIVLMMFAVTVYDCKPEAQLRAGSSLPSARGNRNVDVLRDSMQILDDLYGQGKFNRFPWETGAIWLTESDTVIVRTGDRVEAVMKAEEVVDYLLDYKGFSTHRMTIVLSKLNGDQTETGLLRARPLVDVLNEVGIYTLVVKTDAEWREAYYSTYKYGRIYVWENGQYELDYNGLIVHGTPKELTDWIKALDIEYMAFFPDANMPWADASVMMKAAYERGSRTFSICVCESRGAKSVLAELLKGPQDPGVMSREQKENGFYRTTVLPVKNRDLDREFKGKTVMEVEQRIREEYTDDYENKAIKVVEHPQVFRGGSFDKVIFTPDELVIIKLYRGLGRNVWFRPDVDASSVTKVIADGKEYKFLREEGLQNFTDYPWHDEYNYANGSYFWVPEDGSLYCVDIYEAVPADVKSFDIVEYDSNTLRKQYLAKGVNISGDPNLFEDVQVLDMLSAVSLNLTGTAGPNQAIVQRVEITPSATTVFLEVIVRADVNYPAYFGSDLSLTLNDGQKLSLVSANQPLDKDFRRGGDWVSTEIELVYPPVDMSKLQPDNEKEIYAELTGTVCHTDIKMPFKSVYNFRR